MPNPEKWRPFVLAAAAAIVIGTAFIWREKGSETAPQTPVMRQQQIRAAVKLLQKVQEALPEVKAELRPAACSIYAQLANQIYLMQKLDETDQRNEAFQQNLRAIAANLQAVQQGSDPLADKKGVLVRGYASSLGGIQGYTVSVPEKYDGSQNIPLIVALQQTGNANRWSLSPAPQHPSALCVTPRGFGKPDYKYQAEQDALEVIRDVMQNYAVDPNRIYLAGGTGAWNLAAHHPDLFAAVAPTAGFSGAIISSAASTPAEGSVQEAVDFARSAAAAYSYAENLLNVPIYAMHGGSDSLVPSASSQKMIEAVQQAGNQTVVYRELPGFEHGPFPSVFLRERNSWLLKQVKNPVPKEVRYRTASLRYPGAYWLVIERRPNQLAFSEITGKIAGEQSLAVTVGNVSRFQVKTPPPLLTTDEVTVTINDSIAYKGKPASVLIFQRNHDGWQRVQTADEGAAKRPGLCGPVADAFLSPFLIVYGDGAGVEETSGALMSLLLEGRQQFDVRAVAASEVTEQEIKHYNLVLIGQPQTHSLMAKMMGELPVRIEGNTITCGEKTWRGDDLGAIFCAPNPLNPARYVVVFTATGYDGMLGIASRFGNWFTWPSLKGRNWFDYAVFDNQTFGPNSFLDVGFFDSDWQFDARTRWQRDPQQEYRQRNVPSLTSIDEAPAEFSLSLLRPIVYYSQAGAIGFDQRPDGSALMPNAPRGIAMTVPASVGFKLDGKAREITFTPHVPLQENGTAGPPVRFLMLDEKGNRFYDSGLVQPGEALQPVTRLLHGVKDLALEVKMPAEAQWYHPPAMWLDVRVKKANLP